MSGWLKIEKALFYALIALSFWQWRLLWPAPGGGDFSEWTTLSLYATDLIVAAIFILWAARRPALKAAPEERLLGEKAALAAFLFFSFLSSILATDKILAGYHFVKLLEFAGLYFYLRANFARLYSWKKFWQWFLAGAVLQSLVAIGQFLTQRSLGLKSFAESPLAPTIDGVAKIVVDGEKYIRAYGLVPHPNLLAAMMLMAIFGGTWLVLGSRFAAGGGFGKMAKGAVFAAAFILLAAASFFTFSRGVILVGGILFLAWLVYLWRSGKEYRRVVAGVFLLLAIGYSLLAVIYWPLVSARFDPTALPGSQAVDLRALYDRAAREMIKIDPVWGVGPGNFTVALRTKTVWPSWQYQPAHNLYWLVAAENGLPALLAFLAFLFLTLKAAWPRRRDLFSGGLMFLIGGFLVFGLGDHFLWDLQQGQLMFWLALGLLAGLKKEPYVEKI